MKLRSFVKVGNISNLSDARYCAGFGVNLLGFNVDPNQEDAISWENAQEIIGWVSVEGIVLECGTMSVESILVLKELSNANYYQVDRAEIIDELISNGISIIYRIVIQDFSQIDTLSSSLQSLNDEIKFVVIECDHSEWTEDLKQVLSRLSISSSILNGFDVNSQSILNTSYDGIALKGSQEEKPGFKDYDELGDILEELELED